jgi:hypothetical protein
VTEASEIRTKEAPMSDHLPEHVHTDEPTREPSTSWTGYAAVKYGFIFLIVVAILYFAAAVVIPAITD